MEKWSDGAKNDAKVIKILPNFENVQKIKNRTKIRHFREISHFELECLP